MKRELAPRIEAALEQLLREAGDAGGLPAFALERSRSPEHGDFACNAALLLAKRLGRPPRAIAESLRAALGDAGGLLQRSEIAGPGFLNLWLSEARWQQLIERVLREGERYGHADWGGGRALNVEFVSANPTGPLTLGHGRQAVLGDCLARVLAASGHRVTREYYFNNGGRQMRVLGESVRARYLEGLGLAAAPPPEAFDADEAQWPKEIGGLPVLLPRDGYRGAYITELADELRREYGAALVEGQSESDPENVFRQRAEQRIFAEIRQTLSALGIVFDVYSNEMDLYRDGCIEATLADLRARDLVYESEGAVWLRATAFGLERDRVLVKSSGEPTYLLPDIAYHREKFRRGFERVIDVQGADHKEQFPYVQGAAAALGCPAERIELVMHQFVTLSRGGEQVKQSTRRATYVTVDELLAGVGRDVFRFFMVQRKAEGHLDFDLDLAEETDWKKNPAYYVQYAHARTHGIERQAAEQGVSMPRPEALQTTALGLPEEIEILKKIDEFPEIVRAAAEACEPHHVAYYARELAGLWNPYIQDRVNHRILTDDAALSAARLALTLAVRTVLANALELLGVSAPERM